MKAGKVYLVGAGPGDPGLLTLHARDCLAEADLVIHDYLVDRRCLRFARAGAEIVASGKSGDASHRDHQQREIDEKMVAAARQGKRVVRLKGGDPFVFGRGGEEAEALVAAGIAFEVVPGVSSAVAVPAYAGIPVTERGLASSFTVVTGHEAPGTRHPLDWEALARTETLVFLMGLKALREIVEKLLAAGKDPATPAACIRSGTRPDQQTVVGELASLADLVERAGLRPPAVVVVGEVVKLRERLRWYESRPLLGRRILVTRPRPAAASFVAKLERAGAEAIEGATIEIAKAESSEAIDRAFRELPAFDWIVFTSATGVDVFFERLLARDGDIRDLGPAKLAAIGKATAEALRSRGLRVAVVPGEFRAEALAAALGEQVKGKRVLLPRAGGARAILPEALAAAEARVVDLPTYRAVRPRGLSAEALEALAEARVDAVTFTSSSTVANFVDLLGPDAARKLGRAAVASIGPITSETARGLGLRVDIEAREFTTEGLLTALVDYFRDRG